MYLVVRYAVALVDEGFSVYTVMFKGTFRDVDEIITHYIVMCNAYFTVFEINFMVYKITCPIALYLLLWC